MTSGDWRYESACLDKPPEWFWPEPVNGKLNMDAYDRARTVCSGCPVREDCLTYAIEHREKQGMWGGLSPRERSRERRDRRAAARAAA